VTGAVRSPNVLDLPTIAESGAPGYEVYEWNGIFAPAGTPPAIVDRLQQQIVKAMQHKDVQERVLALGGEIRASTPQAAVEFIRGETAKWAQVVKAGAIKVD
jgi:tripartite-type tricarboxylate transporter receptor subunit TctC